MKKTISLISSSLISALLFSQNAQAQQQTVPAEAVASAAMSCMSVDLPKDWSFVASSLDRSTPKTLVVKTFALTPNSKDVKFIKNCDIRTMAELISAFASNIPADQSNWKQLIFRFNKNGEYSIITDIGLARIKAK